MRRLYFVAGVMALTALGCNDPVSRIPTSPSPPAVAGLSLTGPESIAPGQSVQLSATVGLSDGTVKMTSAGTTLLWFTSNSAILTVNSFGLATARQVSGAAQITVVQGAGATQRQATKEFIVVPDGTYRLAGLISEADFPTVPVANARVTVTPGSLTTLTGFDGRYQLYGVPANALVTVTKSGYATISQAVQLTSHTTRNFNLALDGTRLTIAGSYTLTLDVTGSCSGPRPLIASLQRRTYDAVVTQNGPDVSVLLTEPRFRINSIARGNKFAGRANADGVTFFLDPFDAYYYYYFGQLSYPNVAERLSDNTILVPYGSVTATGSAASLSGNMQGSISLWDSRFPGFNSNILTYCESSAVRFTLTPR